MFEHFFKHRTHPNSGLCFNATQNQNLVFFLNGFRKEKAKHLFCHSKNVLYGKNNPIGFKHR